MIERRISIPDDLLNVDPTDANACADLIDELVKSRAWIKEARAMLIASYDADAMCFKGSNYHMMIEGPVFFSIGQPEG